MNSIQYAMARAAYEAYWEALRDHDRIAFDDLGDTKRRAWLAAAKAAAEALHDEVGI